MATAATAIAGDLYTPAPLEPSTRFDGSATMAEVSKRDSRRSGALFDIPEVCLESQDAGEAGRVSGPRPGIGLSNCHISPRPTRYGSRLEAFVNSPAGEALDEVAKKRELPQELHRSLHGTVRIHAEGTVLECGAIPGWSAYEGNRTGRRGRVSSFSSRSRSRMMLRVSRVKKTCLPIFVTLTYPAQWSENSRDWKRDLDVFGKWLDRAYPDNSFIWKLEPQERGAPHFHLLLFGVPFLPWQDVCVRWVEIVSGVLLSPRRKRGHRQSVGSWPVVPGKTGAKLFAAWVEKNAPSIAIADFLNAGVKVEAIRTRRGVQSYASKLYMGKDCARPDAWEYPGRFWGVHGRKRLGMSAVFEFTGNRATIGRFRRYCRNWMRSRGLRFRGQGAFRIYSESIEFFARLWDLAAEGHADPWDYTACVSPASCPF